MALDLRARISLDGAGFQYGLQSAEKGVASLARRVGALFSVGAVANFAKRIIDWGSEINDVATRLGVSIERAQELRFAATQSGADIGDVATGLTKLADAFETMQAGGAQGQKLLKAFQTLGVTVDDLATKKPDELLNSIANNLSATGVNSEKTAAMLDLFGKSGGKLIPVLTELNAKTKEFQESGLGASPEEIKALDKAGDAIDKLILKMKVLGAQAINDPLNLLKFASFTGQHIENFAEWYKREFGEAIDFGKLPLKPPAVPDYRFLPSAMPPYRPDDEEEQNIDDYNRARARVLRRMAGESKSQRADELVAVGNFLGAGGQLQSVADRELLKQTNLQKLILDEVKLIRSGGSGTLGVPT